MPSAQSPKQRLVHGDYFLDNVLFDDNLQVSAVLDFGAHTLAGDPRLDATSAIIFLGLEPAMKPWSFAHVTALAQEQYGNSILLSKTSTTCITLSISLQAHHGGTMYWAGAHGRPQRWSGQARVAPGAAEKDYRMRMLIWHVDAFAAEPTERGRSKLADETPQTVRVEEALVVFAASEKADEPEPDAVAERAVAAVIDVARRLGEQTVVLHSFAHLFVELSTPATAKAILDQHAKRTRSAGLQRPAERIWLA